MMIRHEYINHCLDSVSKMLLQCADVHMARKYLANNDLHFFIAWSRQNPPSQVIRLTPLSFPFLANTGRRHCYFIAIPSTHLIPSVHLASASPSTLPNVTTPERYLRPPGAPSIPGSEFLLPNPSLPSPWRLPAPTSCQCPRLLGPCVTASMVP